MTCKYILNNQTFNSKEELKDYFSQRRNITKDIIATFGGNTSTTITPYKGTDMWVGVAFRRILKLASDEGYDGIAFATGQQSADMYSLSQQVDKIDITPQGDIKAVYISMKNNADDTVFINQEGVITESASGAYNGKQAEEVLGKDLTRKILETTEETTLEGEGLEFGGEGMKTFYDKIVPKVVQKEAQRFDKNVRLETVDFGAKTNVDIIEEDGGFILKVDNKFVEYVDEETLLNANLENTKEGAKKYFEKYIPQEINADKLSLGVQPYLPLTNSIKESVSQGIPQFQKALSQKGINLIPNGFIYKDQVFLNSETVTPETVMHEFQHLFLNWSKEARPDIYSKGLELARKELEKEGVTVGENVENNNIPSVKEILDIIEEEGLIGEDERFETEDEALEYATQIHSLLFEYYEMGEIPVYRAVQADEVDLDPYAIGESWSFSLQSAKEFARQNNMGNKIISGFVQNSNVNWDLAVRQFMYFSDFFDGASEFELPIPAGNRINNVKVESIKSAKERTQEKSEIKDVIDYVRTTQPNLTGEALENEVITEFIGRYSKRMMDEQKAKSPLMQFLQDFWASVKEMLGITEMTPAQVANLTLEEYAKASVVTLSKGEQIQFQKIVYDARVETRAEMFQMINDFGIVINNLYPKSKENEIKDKFDECRI